MPWIGISRFQILSWKEGGTELELWLGDFLFFPKKELGFFPYI